MLRRCAAYKQQLEALNSLLRIIGFLATRIFGPQFLLLLSRLLTTTLLLHPRLEIRSLHSRISLCISTRF